jgi:F0F1-type ATP synthase delta subunit
MKKVIITSAGNMTDESYKLICDGLEHKLGEKFEFVHQKDGNIIGGFIVNIEGKVYDRSIGSQLEKLKEYMTE